MIEFIKPFFDNIELGVFASHNLPKNSGSNVSDYFPNGQIVITNKGEEAISAAVAFSKKLRGWDYPTIVIPSAGCASIWRAVKDHGYVILMDADETWNCIHSEYSIKADIIVYAHLSGRRIYIPPKSRPDQIIIDDSAQCFDGIIGQKNSDFSIYSFGAGKQMFAGGGGILYSKEHDISKLKDQVGKNIEPWQKWLISSQLEKIQQITWQRQLHAMQLIEGLKDIKWLRLPDQNSVFSKFVVFIKQNDKLSFDPKRTNEIMNFMRYMYQNSIQVEETYIPLHIRFPNEFQRGMNVYKNFNVNILWTEAITLPCRPNLTEQEVDKIIKTVKNYQPITRKHFINMKKEIKIVCINHQPVSLYKEQGWSNQRLAEYYNPCEVAEDCLVLAYQEDKPWSPSLSVKIEGFETIEDIERKIGMFKPDIIRCYEVNHPFPFITLDMARKFEIPSYLSLHDSRKQVVKEFSAYTVITAYTETLAKTTKSIIGKEVEVQRNGVDSDFFDKQKVYIKMDHCNLIHAHINFDHQYDWCIFTVSRNDPVKNIECMIKAVRIFREKSGIDACFVIAGPGFEDKPFKEKWIYTVGKTDENDIRTFLSISDCFFQVQLVPELSMASVEALMIGLPVINAWNMETADLIRWPIGITTNFVSNPQALSECLEFLYHNKKASEGFAGVRRKHAIEIFDAKKLRRQEADRYLRLYKKSMEWKTIETVQQARPYHGN